MNTPTTTALEWRELVGADTAAPFVAPPQVAAIKADRRSVVRNLEQLLQKAAASNRSLLASEQKSFDAMQAEVGALDELLDLADASQSQTQALNTVAKRGIERNRSGWAVRVGGEPITYRREGDFSFIADVMATARGFSPDSAERLQHHDAEVRAVSRVDTTSAGEFVPPLWLVDDFGPALRAGRSAANLVSQKSLPPGTDSLNIPTLNAGTTAITTTAIQTADNASLSSTDVVSNTISVPVRTIGGFEDVALQVIEQSPLAGGFDEMIFTDLLADYNKRLDLQVINGTGASGQMLGILATTGINSVAYVQASPTVTTTYPVLVQQKSQVDKGRFLPATAMLMSPSRFNWHLAAVDSSGRPLVVPSGSGPYNALGVLNPDVAEGGPAGWLAGLPVYLDANIPANLGAGTNEDRIIVARWEDSYLYEGIPKVSAHPDALANTLGMRLRFYNYVAFTAARAPVSICVATGSGMITTTVLAGF